MRLAKHSKQFPPTSARIAFTALALTASCISLSAEPTTHLNDWQVWRGAAQQLCTQRPAYCGCDGFYEEPAPAPELSSAINETERAEDATAMDRFYGVADEYAYSFSGVAELLGNVIIQMDDLEVNANEMILDNDRQIANFSGNVELRYPGMLLSAPNARLAAGSSSQAAVAQMDYAGMLFYETGLRGVADQIELNGDESVSITNGKLTSCAPTDNAWTLNGRNIELDMQSGWGKIRHMTLEVEDVPVFYLPYFTFPLDDRRQSGFLVPTLDLTEPDVALPFYWNIAPEFDMTLTPRFIGSRGTMLQTEFRYLQPQFSGQMNLSLLPNDEQRQAARLDSRRARAQWAHAGDLGAGWVYDLDLNYASDSEYFTDFEDSIVDQTSLFLNRSLSLQYLSPNWSFTSQFQSYQVLDETLALVDYPYRRSPELQLTHFDRLTENMPIFWQNQVSYAYFEQPKAIIPFAHRFMWQSVMSAPTPFFWGVLEPKLELNHRRYIFAGDELSSVRDSQYEFTIPTVSLDARFAMRRDLPALDLWQTLEPRIFLTHTPFEDQSAIPLFDTSELTLEFDQLFLSNPFIGGDRISDRKQITFGLSSRVFRASSGRMLGRADIGQGFSDGERTPVIGRLEFSPVERLFWTNQVNWLDNEEGLYAASTRLSYLRPRNDYNTQDAISIEYRYRDELDNLEQINQYEISVAHTLDHRFRLLGKLRYDNLQDRSFEHLAGIAYNTCCWQASVVYHRLLLPDEASPRALEAEHSVLFEFQLKGFGGLGGGLSKFLREQIPGYLPRNQRNAR